MTIHSPRNQTGEIKLHVAILFINLYWLPTCIIHRDQAGFYWEFLYQEKGVFFWKEAHIWVKNSHKLFNISRRIKHSKQRIFWFPMPNEHPEGSCWSWYTCSYSAFQVSKNLPVGNLISSLKIKYNPSFKDVLEDVLEYNLHVIPAGPKESL